MRFEATMPDSDLVSFGEAINRRFPGTFKGLDAVGSRFSFGICSTNSWQDHVQSLVLRLVQCADVISEFQHVGGDVSIDVAIEPPDYAKLLTSLVFDASLLERLLKAHVSLEVSIYGSPSGQDACPSE